ncbi:chemotaxis protein CheD [Thiovibrio sp. JS02]
MDNLKVVGIGDWLVSADPQHTIRTYALGSCVALVLQHPASTTSGLVHVALPDSLLQYTGTMHGPGYYADTATPTLIAEMQRQCGLYGTAGSGMVARLAGGAKVIRMKKDYHIGSRIVQVMLDILARCQIPVVAMDVGGEISRTVSVHVGSGEVFVSSPGKKEKPLR